MPDRTLADFYIRYPDAVHLADVREAVDNAARAAALATGTKVKIDKYGNLRDGISVATLAEIEFAQMKPLRRQTRCGRSRKPPGYEETGSVSSAIPGLGCAGYTSKRLQSHIRSGGRRSHRCRSSGLRCRRAGHDCAAIRFRLASRLSRRR